MGSLGQDVNVTDITYRNIYTVGSNQMVWLIHLFLLTLMMTTLLTSSST